MTKLTSSQKLVFNDSSKIKLVFHGRRWGASTLAQETAVVHAKDDRVVTMVFPNHRSLTYSFRKIVDRHRDKIDFASRYLEVMTFKESTGKIYFLTSEKVGLTSWSSDSIVVDEAVYCPSDVLYRFPDSVSDYLILTPLVSVRKDWTIKMARRIIQQKRGMELAKAFTFDTFCNPHVYMGNIEDIREDFSPLSYKRVFFALSGGWNIED